LFTEYYNHNENTNLPPYFCCLCNTVHAQAGLLLLQTILSGTFPLPHHLCLNTRHLSLLRHGNRLPSQIQINQRTQTNEVLSLDVTDDVSLLCFFTHGCNIQLVFIRIDRQVYAYWLHFLFRLSTVLLHPLLPYCTTKVLQ